MKKRLILSITVISLLLVFFAPSLSYSIDADSEGYDENTEITIRAKIKEVVITKRGPVVLIVKHRDRFLRIITAPRWYVFRNKIEFSKDAEVEITGSKFFGRDGNFYLSARRIVLLKDNTVIDLRDSSCRPMWHRMH